MKNLYFAVVWCKLTWNKICYRRYSIVGISISIDMFNMLWTNFSLEWHRQKIIIGTCCYRKPPYFFFFISEDISTQTSLDIVCIMSCYCKNNHSFFLFLSLSKPSFLFYFIFNRNHFIRPHIQNTCRRVINMYNLILNITQSEIEKKRARKFGSRKKFCFETRVVLNRKRYCYIRKYLKKYVLNIYVQSTLFFSSSLCWLVLGSLALSRGRMKSMRRNSFLLTEIYDTFDIYDAIHNHTYFRMVICILSTILSYTNYISTTYAYTWNMLQLDWFKKTSFSRLLPFWVFHFCGTSIFGEFSHNLTKSLTSSIEH